jgi:two-component system, chemotaxis family, sensor kinase Cph1
MKAIEVHMTGINFATQDLQLASLKQPSIHILTKIQSHGVVLVLQEPDLRVIQVSNNTLNTFGLDPMLILGQPLEQILDSFQVDLFREGLKEANLDRINPSKIWVRKHGDDYGVFDAVFHRSPDGFLVLELEPAHTNENIPFLSFYHLAKASIGKLTSMGNLSAFGEIVVGEVRKVTGFDRVMLYKFDDDNHGEVIAEDKVPEMESYLSF